MTTTTEQVTPDLCNDTGLTQPAHTVDTPEYRRLTDEQKADIFHLYMRGKTQVEIAQTIGCAQSSVSRWLDKFDGDTAEAARKFYDSNQLKAAVVTVGCLDDPDPEVRLKAATLAHRVSKLLDGEQIRVGVQVVLGVPGGARVHEPEEQT